MIRRETEIYCNCCQSAAGDDSDMELLPAIEPSINTAEEFCSHTVHQEVLLLTHTICSVSNFVKITNKITVSVKIFCLR